MNAKEAIAAVYQGHLVECSEENYPEIREALQDQAGHWIDSNDGVRAMIALEEVRRLDKIFNLKGVLDALEESGAKKED